MVYKILTGGIGGDLRNDADNNGLGNDMLTVAAEDTGHVYNIYTLSGADLIDLQDANAGNGHLVFSGAGRDSVFGGAGVEDIRDQSGNDLFILRGGDDDYRSGRGNDTADGGAGQDGISFLNLYNDAGVPNVNTAGITCDLAKTGVQDFGIFGKDRIKGFEDLEGGTGADRLFGTNGANVMRGSAGNDLLDGRNGADLLLANNGSDSLIGGGGADQLSLFEFDGAARDLVRYTRITDSGTGLSLAAIDVITFFDAGGTATDDRIDLRAIDANPDKAGNQAFLFRGTGNFTSPKGEVRLVEGGGDTLVMVDTDGDGASEMNIRVDDVIGLTASDFLL